MPSPTNPINPTQLPEEARRYLAVVQEHDRHPFVMEFFRQVAWLRIGPAADQLTDLFLIEFRDGLNTAFIWQDEHANWGAGPWIKVAHHDADATCQPWQFSLDYFGFARAHDTFAAALGDLIITRPNEYRRGI